MNVNVVQIMNFHTAEKIVEQKNAIIFAIQILMRMLRNAMMILHANAKMVGLLLTMVQIEFVIKNLLNVQPVKMVKNVTEMVFV